MLRHGCRDVLGFADAVYWQVLHQHFAVPFPAGDCVGVQLYGDEGEIFKGESYMAMNWQSDHTEYYRNSRLSRFLICLIPKSKYAFDPATGVNLTLQAALGEVARSIQQWSTAGVLGLTCRFVGLKGDWKFIVQALSLKFSPSSDQICFLCPASKSLTYPYTDLSAAARWRTETHQEDVYMVCPACPVRDWKFPSGIGGPGHPAHIPFRHRT